MASTDKEEYLVEIAVRISPHAEQIPQPPAQPTILFAERLEECIVA